MSTNAPRGHQRPTFASLTNCEIEHSCVRFGVCGEVRSQSQRHTLCERRPLFQILNQNKQIAFDFRLLLFVLWSQYFTVARTRIQFKKSIKPSCYIPDVTGLLNPFVLVCLLNVYLYAIPCLVPNVFHEVRSQSTFIGSNRLV